MTDYGKYQRVADLFAQHDVLKVVMSKAPEYIEGEFPLGNMGTLEIVVFERDGAWQIYYPDEPGWASGFGTEQEMLAQLEKDLDSSPIRQILQLRVAVLETEVAACREQIARMQRGEVQERCAGWREGQCALCAVDEQNYGLEARVAKDEALLKKLCGLCARACQGSEDVWAEWQR